MAPAVAAPTVKKLGVSSNNNYIQSGARTVSKTSSSSTSSGTSSILRPSASSRGASVRSGVSSVKPVTVSKTTANTATAASKTTGTTGMDEANARLSVGKYIHNSGVNSGYIKPVSTTNEVEAQSRDILNLFDRVRDLESELDKKQNVLSAGDGIDINDDTVAVSDVVSALPERIDVLEQNLDTKIDAETLNSTLNEKYYNKTEVQKNITDAVDSAVIAAQQSGNVYMTNANTNVSEKVSFVNVFDEGVLLSNISDGQQIGNENLDEQEN